MKKFISIASLLLLFMITAGCAEFKIITNTPSPLPTTAGSLKSQSIATEAATAVPDSPVATDPLRDPIPTTVTTVPSIPPAQTPMATLKKDEKIISGPDEKLYFNIYPYSKGNEFEVLGLSSDGGWLVIKLPPYQNNGTGWAHIESFHCDCKIDSLPVIQNPPVPTIGPANRLPNENPDFPIPSIPTPPTPEP